MKRTHRRYDWRLRNLVAKTGDPTRVVHLGIPASTLREWIKRGPVDVVTLPEFQLREDELLEELLLLRGKVMELEAEGTLVQRTIKLFGFQIQYLRLPSGISKSDILGAIAEAAKLLPLQKCLDVIGMSMTRFRHWTRRAMKCELEDQPSCPKSVPFRLTSVEVQTIKSLFTDKKYAHYSITSQSLLGKRLGSVFASPSTWCRIINELGLSRIRKREYPLRPKVGIRASAPNQIWHLDMSIIKLKDHSRVFVQTIIDNFSRYVLA